MTLFRRHHAVASSTQFERGFCTEFHALPKRRRRISTHCWASERTISCCFLNRKVRRRLDCQKTEFDALLSERRRRSTQPERQHAGVLPVTLPTMLKGGSETEFNVVPTWFRGDSKWKVDSFMSDEDLSCRSSKSPTN